MAIKSKALEALRRRQDKIAAEEKRAAKKTAAEKEALAKALRQRAAERTAEELGATPEQLRHLNLKGGESQTEVARLLAALRQEGSLKILGQVAYLAADFAEDVGGPIQAPPPQRELDQETGRLRHILRVLEGAEEKIEVGDECKPFEEILQRLRKDWGPCPAELRALEASSSALARGWREEANERARARAEAQFEGFVEAMTDEQVGDFAGGETAVKEWIEAEAFLGLWLAESRRGDEELSKLTTLARGQEKQAQEWARQAEEAELWIETQGGDWEGSLVKAALDVLGDERKVAKAAYRMAADARDSAHRRWNALLDAAEQLRGVEFRGSEGLLAAETAAAALEERADLGEMASEILRQLRPHLRRRAKSRLPKPVVTSRRNGHGQLGQLMADAGIIPEDKVVNTDFEENETRRRGRKFMQEFGLSGSSEERAEAFERCRKAEQAKPEPAPEPEPTPEPKPEAVAQLVEAMTPEIAKALLEALGEGVKKALGEVLIDEEEVLVEGGVMTIEDFGAWCKDPVFGGVAGKKPLLKVVQ